MKTDRESREEAYDRLVFGQSRDFAMQLHQAIGNEAATTAVFDELATRGAKAKHVGWVRDALNHPEYDDDVEMGPGLDDAVYEQLKVVFRHLHEAEI